MHWQGTKRFAGKNKIQQNAPIKKKLKIKTWVHIYQASTERENQSQLAQNFKHVAIWMDF